MFVKDLKFKHGESHTVFLCIPIFFRSFQYRVLLLNFSGGEKVCFSCFLSFQLDVSNSFKHCMLLPIYFWGWFFFRIFQLLEFYWSFLNLLIKKGTNPSGLSSLLPVKWGGIFMHSWPHFFFLNCFRGNHNITSYYVIPLLQKEIIKCDDSYAAPFMFQACCPIYSSSKLENRWSFVKTKGSWVLLNLSHRFLEKNHHERIVQLDSNVFFDH